jgi:hypothetical protein
MPLENTHPVRVFSQDRSRVGLLTVRCGNSHLPASKG